MLKIAVVTKMNELKEFQYFLRSKEMERFFLKFFHLGKSLERESAKKKESEGEKKNVWLSAQCNLFGCLKHIKTS